MKTNISIFFISSIVFFLPINSFAQIRCGKYPTLSEVQNQIKNKPVNINYKELTVKCNVNDSIKNQFLYLLKPGWTALELNNFGMAKVNENYTWLKIDEKAREIAKDNDSLFLLAKDSIVNFWKDDYTKNLNDFAGASPTNSILLAISYLEIKESIPLLKKYFNSYNVEIAKLALARLGDKKYEKEIIKNYLPDTSLNDDDWLMDMQKKTDKLCFIGTQESIFLLNKWFDTTKLWYRIHSRPPLKAANHVVMVLNQIILNEDFRAKLKSTFPDIMDMYDCNYDNPQILSYCKNWLIKNKGKYKIKRSFYEW
jgi:hypothetical protein